MIADPITKISRILTRTDGSEVKIVASSDPANPAVCIDVYVLRRASPTDKWKACSREPHPDWREMSVDEYVRRGRSELLQAASFADLYHTSKLLGTSLQAAKEAGLVA